MEEFTGAVAAASCAITAVDVAAPWVAHLEEPTSAVASTGVVLAAATCAITGVDVGTMGCV